MPTATVPTATAAAHTTPNVPRAAPAKSTTPPNPTVDTTNTTDQTTTTGGTVLTLVREPRKMSTHITPYQGNIDISMKEVLTFWENA